MAAQPIRINLSTLEISAGGFRRVDYSWMPETAPGALLTSIEVCDPAGSPLLRVPFHAHNGDVRTLHTICGLSDDDPDEIRGMEL